MLSCKNNSVQSVDAKFSDGKPAKVSWVNKENGKNDTIRKLEYYPNGNKKVEGTLKENLRDGRWTYWYENGKIWSEGTFSRGKSNGVFNIFNKDGTKYMQSYYKNGKPDGCWTFFDKNRKKKEVYYKNNNKVKEVDF